MVEDENRLNGAVCCAHPYSTYHPHIMYTVTMVSKIVLEIRK